MASDPRWVRLTQRVRTSPVIGPVLRSIESALGPLDRRHDHHRNSQPIDLDELARHCPPSDEAPIVILGVGWRSGTTMLQRLVVSGGAALVWGEPWHRCRPVRTLADQARAVSPAWLDHLPDVDPDADDVGEAWIANLFPDLSHLLGAHQQYLLRLLRDPAHAAGYERWGLKEVRLDGDDLRYLRMLFPRAKVVIVHRDPRDAWASYRAMGYRAYRQWPDRRVDTVGRFARSWAELATSLGDAATGCDALVVRYDRLQDPATIDELAAHLGIAIGREVVDQRIGSAESEAAFATAPPRHELRVIDRLAGPAMARLGYA